MTYLHIGGHEFALPDVTRAESKGKAHGSGHHYVAPAGSPCSATPVRSLAGAALGSEAS